MKKTLIAAAMIILAGCTTVGDPNAPRPDRQTKSYPQDKEMCMAQPDVPWCQIACDVDDNVYDWCPREP